MVGRQPGPQRRGRAPQRLQKLLRGLQAPLGQQPRRLGGQGGVQRPGGRYQHGPPVRRPKAAARVPQRRQRRRPVPNPDPDRQKPPFHAVGRRRPEHHRHHGVSRCPAGQQRPGVHVGVKHAVHHRHAAPRQQAQSQHTARHGAGNGEEQQDQPQQLLLPAVGGQPQQHARRQLHRRFRQKPQMGQKHRRRVSAPRQGGKNVAPPPQRQARQAGGGEEEQIVHQGVQRENAVDVDDGHAAPSPLFPRVIIGQVERERGRFLSLAPRPFWTKKGAA